MLLLACATLAAPARARVVVVGVDGASWNRVEEGIADGSLPGFAALAARGVTANLATVEPVNSPTVWTSIATGRTPEVHGVTDFYATAHDVRVPTAFERLAARGKRVGLYGWLVTWPPARFPNGFVIPAWLRRDDRWEPRDAFERIGMTPYTWKVERFRSAGAFAAGAREEPAQKSERFVKLLRAFDLDVAATVFFGLDATSHRFWRAAYPQEFADGAGLAPDPRDGGVIRDVLAAADRALAKIAASLAPEDTLLVLSDHGFGPDPRWQRTIWIAHPEAWLRRAGVDPDRDAVNVTNFGFLVLQVLPGPLAERETTLGRLQSLLASATTLDGEPLYRVELRRGNADAQAAAKLQQRVNEVIRERAIGWLGPHLDAPSHAFLVAIPRDDVLGALAPDARVRLAGEEVPLDELLRADRFSGDHTPTALFVAAGGPIRREPERQSLSVLDVAPLLFHLAGEAVPDDLRDVPRHLLDPAWLAAHAPRRIPASEMPGLPRGSLEAGADDEDVTDRLRALGYVR